eukprot:gene5830-4157_t
MRKESCSFPLFLSEIQHHQEDESPAPGATVAERLESFVLCPVHTYPFIDSRSAFSYFKTMGRISAFCFKGCKKKLRFCGSPAQFRGVGHEMTASYVHTTTEHGEPLIIHCVPGYISTLYLAQYPIRSSFLLLDCGSPSDFHRIKYYIENVLSRNMEHQEEGSSNEHEAQLGMTAFTIKEHIKLGVVSHCHIDHSGGSGGYSQLGVPLAQPHGIEQSYIGMGGKFHQLMEILISFRISRRMGRKVFENAFEYSQGFLGPYWTLPSPSTGSKILRDGDVLPNGFDDWSVVRIPGHTTHMIGLYHCPSRSFYAADLFVKLRKGYYPPFPIHFGWAYRHSLERVRQLEVQCLLLPHGGIVNLSQPTGEVEIQSTPWSTIIDEVIEKFDQARGKKKKYPIAGVTSVFKVANGIFSVFSRWRWTSGPEASFTPADLDTGPLPWLIDASNAQSSFLVGVSSSRTLKQFFFSQPGMTLVSVFYARSFGERNFGFNQRYCYNSINLHFSSHHQVKAKLISTTRATDELDHYNTGFVVRIKFKQKPPPPLSISSLPLRSRTSTTRGGAHRAIIIIIIFLLLTEGEKSLCYLEKRYIYLSIYLAEKKRSKHETDIPELYR